MLAGARVLLTGATGRLGRCVAIELTRAGCDLLLVVRGPSQRAANERVREALGTAVVGRKLEVVCGDVTLPSLGLTARDRRRVSSSLDAIVHAAASTSFSLPLEDARATNVQATTNLLAFAERAPRLRRHLHVSTAFVAGRRTGRVLEAELEHDEGFLNSYQQSKQEAELIVERYRNVLPIVVARPSIVLDGPGSIQRRSAFRFAYDLVRRGIMRALPGTRTTPVDLVSEDDAARAIVRLLFASGVEGTYHVAGGELAPTIHDLVGAFGVRYLEERRFAWELARWKRERPQLAAMYRELESFIYELAYPKVFDTSRVEQALGAPVVTEDSVALLAGEPCPAAERTAVAARAR